MSKVIAFFGSPREKGNSTKLMKQVIAGAKSVGAEIVTYKLNEEGVKGCQACNYCRTNEGCATKDKLQSMYQEIKEADGIVAGFPIYFRSIGGQSKQWVDRLSPMIGDNFSPRYPGKKMVTVYSQANPDKDLLKNAIESNDGIFKIFGWDLVESLLSYGGGDPQYVIPQELMDRAFNAGKQLVE